MDLREARNNQILRSSNENLYRIYNQVVLGLWHFRNIKELSEDFKIDKKLIKSELKKRNLKTPSFLYDLILCVSYKSNNDINI